MKKLVNIILSLCVLGLVYLCYTSIITPLRFEQKRLKREAIVIAKLTDIGKIQLEYLKHYGHYAPSFDLLMDFINTGSIVTIFKVGELTERHRKLKLTEEQVTQLVTKAKATNNWSKLQEYGLEHFRRDTTYTPILGSLFDKDYPVQELPFIPYSNHTQFQLTTRVDTVSNVLVNYIEVSAPYRSFLNNIDQSELDKLIQDCTLTGRYPGLKIGSMESPNIIGSWELF